jgi:hypothetical protein
MQYLVLLTPVVALALLVVLSRLEDWSLRNRPGAGRRHAGLRRRGGHG